MGEAGVPAMHAGLMPNGRVVFLDKVEAFTQLKLPNGQYAYSAEYDPETNQALGLSYKVNTVILLKHMEHELRNRRMPSAQEVLSSRTVASSRLVVMAH